jgi:hypothetical protein
MRSTTGRLSIGLGTCRHGRGRFEDIQVLRGEPVARRVQRLQPFFGWRRILLHSLHLAQYTHARDFKQSKQQLQIWSR